MKLQSAPPLERPSLDLMPEDPYLIQLVKAGEVVKACLAIKEGHDFYQPDSNGNSALHLASFQGFEVVISTIIGEIQKKENALYWFQKLSNTGLNIDLQNSFGQTPLHLALIGGHTKTLKLLLNSGTNFTSGLALTDTNGNTALHLASILGDIDSLGLMLGCLKNSAGYIQLFGISALNTRNSIGLSPLHLALSEPAQHDCALEMIKMGADLTIKAERPFELQPNDGADQPASYSPIDFIFKYGHCKALHYLVTQNLRFSMKSWDYRYLLNDKFKNNEGLNVPGLYALHGEKALIKALYQNIAVKITFDNCYTLADSKGRQPIHLATQGGSVDTFEEVLEYAGVEALDATDHQGNTPLHYAAMYGSKKIAHYVFEKYDTDQVMTLLESGLNPTNKLMAWLRSQPSQPINLHTKSKLGLTAYFLAFRNGHYDICQLFETRGNFKKETLEGMLLSYIQTKPDEESFRFVSRISAEYKSEIRRIRDSNRNTLVHLCAHYGQYRYLNIILNPFNSDEKKEFCEEKNNNLETALEIIPKEPAMDIISGRFVEPSEFEKIKRLLTYYTTKTPSLELTWDVSYAMQLELMNTSGYRNTNRIVTYGPMLFNGAKVAYAWCNPIIGVSSVINQYLGGGFLRNTEIGCGWLASCFDEKSSWHKAFSYGEWGCNKIGWVTHTTQKGLGYITQRAVALGINYYNYPHPSNDYMTQIERAGMLLALSEWGVRAKISPTAEENLRKYLGSDSIIDALSKVPVAETIRENSITTGVVSAVESALDKLNENSAVRCTTNFMQDVSDSLCETTANWFRSPAQFSKEIISSLKSSLYNSAEYIQKDIFRIPDTEKIFDEKYRAKFKEALGTTCDDDLMVKAAQALFLQSFSFDSSETVEAQMKILLQYYHTGMVNEDTGIVLANAAVLLAGREQASSEVLLWDMLFKTRFYDSLTASDTENDSVIKDIRAELDNIDLSLPKQASQQLCRILNNYQKRKIGKSIFEQKLSIKESQQFSEPSKETVLKIVRGIEKPVGQTDARQKLEDISTVMDFVSNGVIEPNSKLLDLVKAQGMDTAKTLSELYTQSASYKLFGFEEEHTKQHEAALHKAILAEDSTILGLAKALESVNESLAQEFVNDKLTPLLIESTPENAQLRELYLSANAEQLQATWNNPLARNLVLDQMNGFFSNDGNLFLQGHYISEILQKAQAEGHDAKATAAYLIQNSGLLRQFNLDETFVSQQISQFSEAFENIAPNDMASVAQEAMQAVSKEVSLSIIQSHIAKPFEQLHQEAQALPTSTQDALATHLQGVLSQPHLVEQALTDASDLLFLGNVDDSTYSLLLRFTNHTDNPDEPPPADSVADILMGSPIYKNMDFKPELMSKHRQAFIDAIEQAGGSQQATIENLQEVQNTIKQDYIDSQPVVAQPADEAISEAFSQSIGHIMPVGVINKHLIGIGEQYLRRLMPGISDSEVKELQAARKGHKSWLRRFDTAQTEYGVDNQEWLRNSYDEVIDEIEAYAVNRMVDEAFNQDSSANGVWENLSQTLVEKLQVPKAQQKDIRFMFQLIIGRYHGEKRDTLKEKVTSLFSAIASPEHRADDGIKALIECSQLGPQHGYDENLVLIRCVKAISIINGGEPKYSAEDLAQYIAQHEGKLKITNIKNIYQHAKPNYGQQTSITTLETHSKNIVQSFNGQGFDAKGIVQHAEDHFEILRNQSTTVKEAITDYINQGGEKKASKRLEIATTLYTTEQAMEAFNRGERLSPKFYSELATHKPNYLKAAYIIHALRAECCDNPSLRPLTPDEEIQIAEQLAGSTHRGTYKKTISDAIKSHLVESSDSVALSHQSKVGAQQKEKTTVDIEKFTEGLAKLSENFSTNNWLGLGATNNLKYTRDIKEGLPGRGFDYKFNRFGERLCPGNTWNKILMPVMRNGISGNVQSDGAGSFGINNGWQHQWKQKAQPIDLKSKEPKYISRAPTQEEILRAGEAMPYKIDAEGRESQERFKELHKKAVDESVEQLIGTRNNPANYVPLLPITQPQQTHIQPRGTGSPPAEHRSHLATETSESGQVPGPVKQIVEHSKIQAKGIYSDQTLHLLGKDSTDVTDVEKSPTFTPGYLSHTIKTSDENIDAVQIYAECRVLSAAALQNIGDNPVVRNLFINRTYFEFGEKYPYFIWFHAGAMGSAKVGENIFLTSQGNPLRFTGVDEVAIEMPKGNQGIFKDVSALYRTFRQGGLTTIEELLKEGKITDDLFDSLKLQKKIESDAENLAAKMNLPVSHPRVISEFFSNQKNRDSALKVAIEFMKYEQQIVQDMYTSEVTSTLANSNYNIIAKQFGLTGVTVGGITYSFSDYVKDPSSYEQRVEYFIKVLTAVSEQYNSEATLNNYIGSVKSAVEGSFELSRPYLMQPTTSMKSANTDFYESLNDSVRQFVSASLEPAYEHYKVGKPLGLAHADK